MTENIGKEIIKASSEDLKKLQLRLLKEQIRRVYETSSFYREKFEKAGIKPSDIQTLKDIQKIPFSRREEFEQNFYNVLTIPRSDIATIRLTSGITGSPLRIAHSKKDIEQIVDASARRLTYHGITNKDIIQITSAYGLWQAAWSMHWGAEKIGACIIPVGPADTERQILLIKQFGTSVLYAVTNYHFRILEVAKAMGEDLKKYNLKTAFCVGEKPTSRQISTLKEEFGYDKVIIDYGATEFPGFSVNCSSHEDEHHIWADYYLVEIVDPETHEPLEEGEKGELVVTSLQREAFPLIRYLSRDVTEYIGYEKCNCGLSHPRISADIDREDFMTKIRGVTIFPSHLEHLLAKFDDLTGKCQIIVDKRTPKHITALRIETTDSFSKTSERALTREIVSQLKNKVGITFNEVVFITPGELEGKYQKVICLK